MSLLTPIRFILRHPLNRDHKISSLVDFLKWQIGSRLVAGAIVHDWVNGTRFFVKAGETGLTGNIYSGLHEFSDMGFLLHFLRGDDLFVDVGANVGSYTILACAAVGARGIAFEPVPGTFIRLRENLHLNHLAEKVHCVNKGVGADKGWIHFTTDSDTTNHALAPGEQCMQKVTVEVVSLDEALEGDVPALLKIDVEGYETLVLRGARGLLQSPRLHAVIVELNGSGLRYGFNESEILDSMSGYGFERCLYDPLSRKLENLVGEKDPVEGNTLFIRNRSYVEERVSSAPKVSLRGKYF